MKTATSTEVGGRFGEILMEVKHGGQTLTITKNGEKIAVLSPVHERECTLSEFPAFWKEFATESDDAFARDLDKINRSEFEAIVGNN